MKNMNDITVLQSTPCKMFINGYSFLIERLAEYYLSKSDGRKRISEELSNWDEESRIYILNDLRKNIENSGIQFDW